MDGNPKPYLNTRNGNCAVIEQFLADNFQYMFGNPGTSEEGFLDALSGYPGLKYILSLQESIAVMTADGYARARQQPALVQLHSSPGIGNGVGALYQAKRGHSPLVVIGGDAGVKYMNMDAQMAGDLVGMMEPVTKYAAIAMDKASVLRVLRRAVKIAATPPMGPVYVCLPMDVLDEINNEEIFSSCVPSTRVAPATSVIEETAKLMLGAKNPVIFVGDGVAHSQAVKELERVSELTGAEVYGVDTGDLLMDQTHPFYMGSTGHMFGSYSSAIAKKGDVNLIVGTYMLPDVFPELASVYAEGAKVIHFDLNAYEIAKNHKVDIGVVCDPKTSLGMLAVELDKRLTQADRSRMANKLEQYRNQKRTALQAFLEEDKSRTTVTMAHFARELARKLPGNAIIFDEALTSSPELTRYVQSRNPGSYFVTRGGSLGVGIPGAIGAKLACPENAVWGFTGDGGSMYTIQALWTASHHGIGAKFVICNNRSYRLLKLNIDEYWKEKGTEAHVYPAPFSLTGPVIDFSALSRSMGVPAVKVDTPDKIESSIEQAMASNGPFLIDLVIGNGEQ